jgi:hypothetical protein
MTYARGVLVTAVALAAACGGQPTERDAVTARDSAGVAIVENDLSLLDAVCRVDSVPTVRIGTPEGAEEYELNRVFGASQMSDGRIVLVNQGTHEIRFYDAQGKFLQRYGRSGEGPGEFRRAFGIVRLPGDTLYVGDYRPWQTLVFDPAGKWVRTVRPTPLFLNNPDAVGVLDDGRLILGEKPLMEPNTEFPLQHLLLTLHAPDGTVRDTLGNFPDGRWGVVDGGPNDIRLFPLFESFTRLAVRGSRLAIGHTSRSELTLYRVADSLVPEALVRWEAGDRGISAADISAERTRLAEGSERMPPDQKARFVDPLISTKRPVADLFPAFTRVVIGMDGRLWVREYRRPTVLPFQRWIGFDAQGRYQCRASLPAEAELLEIGNDYLLTRERDADDVERVVRYGIAPPVRQ